MDKKKLTVDNYLSKDIKLASRLLEAGKLVSIPTETVYGLGCNALDVNAVKKVFAAKGRPSDNPLIVHILNETWLQRYALDIPEDAYILAKKYWPGALTLILKKNECVPNITTANQESIALRVPNHPLTLSLLEEFDKPIAAPSANKSGKISPTTASDVYNELNNKVELILNGGDCNVGIESTILSLLDPFNPIILRQGMIDANDIANTLQKNVSIMNNSNSKIITPGSFKSHYAPSKNLKLLDFEELLTNANNDETIGIISFNEKPIDCNNYWIKASKDPFEYAKTLYSNMRKLDNDKRCKSIIIEKPKSLKNWEGIIDRLTRASY